MKAFSYTKKFTTTVSRELSELFEKEFGSNVNDFVIAVTGSHGKDLATPNSDVDMMCILSDSSKVNPKAISRKLSKITYKLPFELYPICSLSEWKLVAEKSILYATDIFYSRSIFGNKNILENLIEFVSLEENDLKNQIPYFIYNYLYRSAQLKKNARDLKYRKAGLRDMQFIQWVARRRTNGYSSDPRTFINGLFEKKYISGHHVDILNNYFDRIINVKISNDKPLEDQLVNETMEALQSIKDTILAEYSDVLKVNLKTILEKIENDSLSRKERRELYSAGGEPFILLAIWNSDDVQLLEKAFRDNRDYWSIRAALSQNVHTPLKILLKLFQHPSYDNEDIKMFVSRNSAYNYENKK